MGFELTNTDLFWSYGTHTASAAASARQLCAFQAPSSTVIRSSTSPTLMHVDTFKQIDEYRKADACCKSMWRHNQMAGLSCNGLPHA